MLTVTIKQDFCKLFATRCKDYLGVHLLRRLAFAALAWQSSKQIMWRTSLEYGVVHADLWVCHPLIWDRKRLR